MIDVSEDWLKQLGVNDPDSAEFDKLYAATVDELELRVGNRLVKLLSATQVAEFEAIEGEEAKLAWLEKTCPDYKSIVAEEYELLSTQIRETADKTALIRSWA